MTEKKNKQYSASRETSIIQIADSARHPNSFVTEFLEYCQKYDVYPLPKVYVIDAIVEDQFSSRSNYSMPSLIALSDKDKQPTESVRSKLDSKEKIPIVYATYKNLKKLESLQKLQCKNYEVSVGILDALSLALQNCITITVLKLQNCRINAYGITQIAQILTEIGCVRDLNLDMNPNTQENYYLLCLPTARLLYLSLKLCNISDKGVKKIAKELKYKDEPNTPKLIALNLSNNNITDVGAEYISSMLRSNRSLQSLVLTGNRIYDAGATSIIQQLRMFSLTHSEIVDLRRRRLARLILEKDNLEDLRPATQNTRENEDFIKEEQVQKSDVQIQRRMTNSSNLSRRIKKGVNSINRQEFSSKTCKLSDTILLNAAKDAIKSSLDPDCHPLSIESVPIKGAIVSSGNLELQHLNLSFNRLTNKTLKEFVSCIQYQDYMLLDNSTKGLLYIHLEGNDFQENNNEYWMQLKELLDLRRHQDNKIFKREDSEVIANEESKILRSKIKINIMCAYVYDTYHDEFLIMQYFVHGL